MKNNVNFKNETMDDIVFDNRNKEYGAFALRKGYARNLLTAIAIAVFIFSFGTFSPVIAKQLGLFEDAKEEKLDTVSVQLEEIKSIKPDEPPPPPPPPPVEVQAPTIAFLEIQAVKKDEADKDPPPTVKELEKPAVISDITKEGDINAKNPIVPSGNGDKKNEDRTFDENEVQQKPRFGKGTFQDFVDEEFDNTNVDSKSGTAEVYFTLDKSGRIIPSTIRLKRSSGNPGLDKEALRIAKIQPAYSPAKNNGEAVEVQCSVKVSYSAEDSDEN